MTLKTIRFIFSLALPLAVSSICFAQPTVDGTKVGDSYGAALSVQTNETGFGDSAGGTTDGSEWDAAYGLIDSGKLFLMLTGNLSSNFNKLEIFIDSTDAVTSNTYATTTDFNDGANIMNGMTFDAALSPDYHLIMRRGSFGGDKFDVNFLDLGNDNASEYFDIAGGSFDNFSVSTGAPTNSTATPGNANPIEVGFSNDNTAGILGCADGNIDPPGCAAADQSAAQLVDTGLELGIDLADLGNPTGPIKVMVLQNNDNHDFLSNQTLGGLPAGTLNLADPAATQDFNAIDGDQFFTVPEPAAGLFALCLVGWFLRRRR